MSQSDISARTTFRFTLHDYAREPVKRAIAEGKFKEQHEVCAKLDPALCVPMLELHHVDGDPKNWAWGNVQLLCETHHRAETNRQRAEARRSSNMCVKVGFAGAGLSPHSVSLENEKSENYTARFLKAAPEWFKVGPDPQHPLEQGAVVSVKTFTRAMIGACTYTDEAGKVHQPSSATMHRYIDDRIYPDNPNGWFEYAQTTDSQDGIRWAAKP